MTQPVRVRWERPSARLDGEGWMVVESRRGRWFAHRGSCRDAEQLALILLGEDLVRVGSRSAVLWTARRAGAAPRAARPDLAPAAGPCDGAGRASPARARRPLQ